jgi:hypothetical protein
MINYVILFQKKVTYRHKIMKYCESPILKKSRNKEKKNVIYIRPSELRTEIGVIIVVADIHER